MSEPPPQAQSARLFCALDLPTETISSIVAWQRAAVAPGETALRAVEPGALHVTLAFLGEQPVELIEPAAEAVRRLRRRPIAARLRPDPVPVPRRRPRLLALEIESDGARALQAELAEHLREAGLSAAERRPFWPHLTVFRLRGSGRGRDGGRRRVERVDPLRDGDGHAFGFVRVALYRSDLRPEGASYSRLAANELPRAGGRQKR